MSGISHILPLGKILSVFGVSANINEMKKAFIMVVMVSVGLLFVSCEEDSSALQSDYSTINVNNTTAEFIHVEYKSAAWDITNTGIGPYKCRELLVYFSNRLGTSRIKVTKSLFEKDYDEGFGDHSMAVRASDFIAQ